MKSADVASSWWENALFSQSVLNAANFRNSRSSNRHFSAFKLSVSHSSVEYDKFRYALRSEIQQSINSPIGSGECVLEVRDWPNAILTRCAHLAGLRSNQLVWPRMTTMYVSNYSIIVSKEDGTTHEIWNFLTSY